MNEPLNRPALEGAVRTVLTHHDALRARFVRNELGWHQRITPPSDCDVVYYVDLSTVSEAETMSNFKSTIERIRALESERKNLLLEIEELKRMADAKAKALESEINMLRDE